MEDLEYFQLTGRGHPSRREANWERRVSSVSDSVALDAVTAPPPATGTRLSEAGRRAALSRQDALSSGSSNTDSTSRLHSSVDSCGSLPWLLSPAGGVQPSSPALSPLWTGSGLPPPPSWPGVRPASATVQRSVSSASSRGARPTCYAGWTSDDKFSDVASARTRHTANSQPTMAIPRQAALMRPPPASRSQRPGDWIMQHARVKPKARPHQLPGLRASHDLQAVVRRRAAATNSDNSLSSSDSGGGPPRARSRDRQVPVAAATSSSDCKQQPPPPPPPPLQFLSVDSIDEVRYPDSYPPLRPAAGVPPPVTEPAGRAAEDAGNESSVMSHPVTSQSLGVPAVNVRRRSVSLARTSATFSRAFDDDDAQ